MQLFQKRLSEDRANLQGKLHKYSSQNNIKQQPNNLSPLRYRWHRESKQGKQNRRSRDNVNGNIKHRPLSKASEQSQWHNTSKDMHKTKYINCAIHSQKQAQYCYISQNDTLFYCCICAAKLASQGFNMQKICHVASTLKISRYNSDNNRITNADQKQSYLKNFQKPHKKIGSQKPLLQNNQTFGLKKSRKKPIITCNKYVQNQLIKQINDLAYEIQDLLKKYSELIQFEEGYFQNFMVNYDCERDKELVIKFYQKIVDIVIQYRQKHLQKLDDIGKFIGSKDKIKSNISELSTINEDMLSTDFDLVLDKVSETDFKTCLDFYKMKYTDCLKEYNEFSSKIHDATHEGSEIKSSIRHQVSQIQQNIDKIEHIIKQFCEPGLLQNNENRKPVHNLIRLYEKGLKPKLHSKNPFQNCLGQNRNSPNFKQF